MALVLTKPTTASKVATSAQKQAPKGNTSKVSAPNRAPTLTTIVKDRPSLYLKLAALIRSVVASGKPTERTKMRNYFKGVLTPDSADKSGKDLTTLFNGFMYYYETGDASAVTDILDNTDDLLKTVRQNK